MRRPARVINYVNAHRRANGLTQVQLAAECGIAHSYLPLIERRV